MRSNGQGPVCDAVKRSSNKNDGQNILTPVAAVTTAPMAVTTPCIVCINTVLYLSERGSEIISNINIGYTLSVFPSPGVYRSGVPGAARRPPSGMRGRIPTGGRPPYRMPTGQMGSFI